MNVRLFLIVLSTCLFFGCATSPKAGQNQAPAWQSLFNGQNMDGWLIKIKGYDLGENYAQTFRVEEGLLKIAYDQYGRFDNKFGALYYEKPFRDYRLKVEYRFVGDTAQGAPPWGFRDSGIQYHSQSPQSLRKDQSFPICLEYNIHGGNGVEERPVGQICANGTLVDIAGKANESYCTPPTVSRTVHGDQWTTAEIEIKAGKISHWLNGEKIMEFSNPRFNAKHDLGKTFITEDGDALNAGYISLQSNSHPIQFRRIEIMTFD